MIENKTTKYIIFTIALIMLIAAVIWTISIGQNDELKKVADRINAYGYRFRGEDIYILGESRDVSIISLLDEGDIRDAVAASVAAGFASDIHAIGDVVVMLIQVDDDGNVITIYLRDGEIELCFVRNIDTEEVKMLGA